MSIINISCSDLPEKAQAKQDFKELSQAIDYYLEEGTLTALETALTYAENNLESYEIGSPSYHKYLKAYVELYFDDDEITAAKVSSMLRKRLESPRVKEWFSDKWTLYNECTILYTDASGHVCERRPDRVMSDGQRLVVVDFKFGHSRPEYQEQVREYMSLLKQMGHSQVEGYIWYVYSNQIESVR